LLEGLQEQEIHGPDEGPVLCATSSHLSASQETPSNLERSWLQPESVAKGGQRQAP
jgi:hypothetical protein